MVVRKDFRRTPPQRVSFLSRFSVTTILIILNVVLFFLFLLLTALIDDFTNFIAIRPSFILSGQYLWTIISSMFMHAGFFHLFVNMFSLFFLGSLTERIIGRKRYFWFYILAGVVGSIFFTAFAYFGQNIPRGDFLFGSVDDFAVGASGAIFGLLGILAMLLPKKQIYLIIGPLIVIVVQFVLGYLLPSAAGTIDFIASLLIFLMIFAIFSPSAHFRKVAVPLRLPFWLAPIIAIVPLLLIGLFIKLPIGNSAHIGGLVAGIVYGGYLRAKYTQKVKVLNRMIR